MRSFVLLLMVIVNSVLSAPSPIDELESKSSISAQRSSNTNGVLQVGDHVHVPEEERELALNIKSDMVAMPEVKAAMSEVKVVPASIGARLKAGLQRWIAKIKFLWKTRYLIRRDTKKPLLMGYTPGYMASLLRKIDPGLSGMKVLSDKGQVKEHIAYKNFVSFDKEYKDLLNFEGGMEQSIERLDNLRTKEMELSWIDRRRFQSVMNKTRRILEKGLPAEKLLDLNIFEVGGGENWRYTTHSKIV
ncbi:hypothetical protein Plhal304r1_c080g0165791 [Plasmopara halstedii]